MQDIITLDYGSGGKKTSALIEELILPQMKSNALNELLDGAVVSGSEKLAFSTDSFVVSPYIFPGGNIGKLAVCGTVNDVAMCGAVPKYLSLSFIIEEGLPTEDLRLIVSSVAECAKKAGVTVVTGDTKVVERGRGDGIYINTAGIGFMSKISLSPKNIREGDRVIISGTCGDHGAAIMLARNKNLLDGEIKSDCAPLNSLCEKLFSLGKDLRVLRDPTRGGAATTLCEFTENTELSIELFESSIPIDKTVAAACDILGLDPLYCACEGKLLCVVSKEAESAALEIMKSTPEGKNAAVIGEVTRTFPGRVALKTDFGTRILSKLSGAQLPRIC